MSWMSSRIRRAAGRVRRALGAAPPPVAATRPATPRWTVAPLRPVPVPKVDEEAEHPETRALVPWCRGRGIDVGCGHRKVTPECIGVDILAQGEEGAHGVVKGQSSVADVHASGDALPMFRDGELDFVVSRHNLEHYVDVVKTLQEWRRVLRPGGVMGIIVPDERAGDTVFLDPTHKHCFTPESLARLIEVVGGLRVIRQEVVVPDWSFLTVAVREDRPAGDAAGPGA